MCIYIYGYKCIYVYVGRESIERSEQGQMKGRWVNGGRLWPFRETHKGSKQNQKWNNLANQANPTTDF